MSERGKEKERVDADKKFVTSGIKLQRKHQRCMVSDEGGVGQGDSDV